jgi:hypothetical protein
MEGQNNHLTIEVGSETVLVNLGLFLCHEQCSTNEQDDLTNAMTVLLLWEEEEIMVLGWVQANLEHWQGMMYLKYIGGVVVLST